jgi:AbrB family looped-hinge helix DNA binding protein
MKNVKVSPKYQVVIPKNIRESMSIRPGMEVSVFQYSDRIEYVPIKPIQSLRGFVKGIDTELERDNDRV